MKTPTDAARTGNVALVESLQAGGKQDVMNRACTEPRQDAAKRRWEYIGDALCTRAWLAVVICSPIGLTICVVCITFSEWRLWVNHGYWPIVFVLAARCSHANIAVFLSLKQRLFIGLPMIFSLQNPLTLSPAMCTITHIKGALRQQGREISDEMRILPTANLPPHAPHRRHHHYADPSQRRSSCVARVGTVRPGGEEMRAERRTAAYALTLPSARLDRPFRVLFVLSPESLGRCPRLLLSLPRWGDQLPRAEPSFGRNTLQTRT